MNVYPSKDGLASMPQRVISLPRDKNGFPIMPTVQLDAEGQPNYILKDLAKWSSIVKEQRCGVCGQPIDLGIFTFIGGQDAAHSRKFYDPAMHTDCAWWAINVCPWIALRPQDWDEHNILSADYPNNIQLFVYTSKGYRVEGKEDKITLVSREFISYHHIYKLGTIEGTDADSSGS